MLTRVSSNVGTIRRVSLDIRGFGILAVILILIVSFTLFFYFQHVTQEQVKSQLFEEQKYRQITSTKQIANYIGSDLTLVLSYLEGISDSKYLQDGQFYDQEIRQLATEKYNQMSEIVDVDRLFILNDKDISVVGAGSFNPGSGTIAPVGNDLSFREWVKETRNGPTSIFSEGFEHVGEYRIIITNPVIDRDNKEYLGLVGVSIPTVRFFDSYLSAHDVNSPFLLAYDREGTILAAVGNGNLAQYVGSSFFEEDVQDFIQHNPTLNEITTGLLQGVEGYAVYDHGIGERLTTYQPINVAGRPTYFLQLVTPTETVYQQIDSILSTENEKMALLLVGATGASALLIIFLLIWNTTLNKEVKKRTRDLKESNRLLGVSNEQLRERERLQNEFINIAAHEMRTPIQPILGLSEIIQEKVLNLAKHLQMEEKVVYQQLQDVTTTSSIPTRSNSIYRSSFSSSLLIEKIIPMIDVINRNAKRLEKLTDNLLDLSRIENNKVLVLNKEIFAIDPLIRDCMIDAGQHIGNKNLKFSYLAAEGDDQKITIKADRSRITQVLTNLLDNSIKFSEDGIISVTTTVDHYANSITVSVRDTGSGINPVIIPRLFTKFATASEKGTGLGLYISKKTIEAHGGKVWAENNKDGKGATFSFTLPVYCSDSDDSRTG